MDKIALSSGNKEYIIIKLDNILYCESAGAYTDCMKCNEASDDDYCVVNVG